MPDPCRWIYEWTISPADKGRDPWHVFLSDRQPFSFAGIWAYNKTLDITSCSIINLAHDASLKETDNLQG